MNDNTVVAILVIAGSLVAGAAGYFVRATDISPWKARPTWAHIKDKEGKVTKKVAAMGLGANVIVSLTAGWIAYLSADVIASALLVGSVTGTDGKVTTAGSLTLYSVQALAVLLGAFGGANFIQKVYDKRIDSFVGEVAKKDSDEKITRVDTALVKGNRALTAGVAADEKAVFFRVETNDVQPEVTYK